MRWLKQWWARREARSESRRVQRRIDVLESQIDKQVQRLEKREAAVKEAHAAMIEEIDDSKKVLKRAEEEVEHLRSRNRIVEDTTVPMLVAANNQILARLDAETAIQTRRQVLAAAGESE